jgi:branched-chain amino acid transport system permease protein
VAGRVTEPFSLFGLRFDRDETYFYVVLALVVVMFLGAASLMRTRDGRALVAVRDHYLSAEMMGINLAYYWTLSFGIASFYAGIGGARADRAAGLRHRRSRPDRP